ncbi:DoxX family protein [Streptomyces sp. NPDC057428]|uniref:DoxX family protein n=1 Tax=Streptomyces sp. NPDC057428 TaxID=3346129 RepID=UPI00368950CD
MGPARFTSPNRRSPPLSVRLNASVIQLVGGTLVALGLGTRAAALITSGSMAYAYLIVFTGPGAVALDRLLSSRAGTVRVSGPRPEKARPVSV